MKKKEKGSRRRRRNRSLYAVPSAESVGNAPMGTRHNTFNQASTEVEILNRIHIDKAIKFVPRDRNDV
jgi:hypothetical protein